MYICESCKKRPATVHLTDIHKNVKKEVHLCEQCAESKGVTIKHELTMTQLLGELASTGKAKKKRASEAEDIEAVCDTCGMSLMDFREKGRLGCARDYELFREQLRPLIESYHNGSYRHTGRRLGEVEDERARRMKQIQDCRRRLQDAVDREAYEEAAGLRDRLAELQGAAGN